MNTFIAQFYYTFVLDFKKTLYMCVSNCYEQSVVLFIFFPPNTDIFGLIFIVYKIIFCFFVFSYIVPCLIQGWKDTLPNTDHHWVCRALFKYNNRGQPEFDPNKATKLWYYQPQSELFSGFPPSINKYFGQRLLLWMPRKLWKVKLLCPHEGCNAELTSAGIYPRVWQVLDLDSFYNLASEYLVCSKCKRKAIAWSLPVVNQLDVGHRRQFPLSVTYNYACDMRVVCFLRQRGLSNSSTQLQKKLTVQHNESWLNRVA